MLQHPLDKVPTALLVSKPRNLLLNVPCNPLFVLLPVKGNVIRFPSALLRGFLRALHRWTLTFKFALVKKNGNKKEVR